MAQVVGGEEAAERISSQSTTIEVLGALIGALAFSGILAPPPEASEGAQLAYAISMSLSVIFNLGAVVVCSHVIIHMNSVEWTTEALIMALKKYVSTKRKKKDKVNNKTQTLFIAETMLI